MRYLPLNLIKMCGYRFNCRLSRIARRTTRAPYIKNIVLFVITEILNMICTAPDTCISAVGLKWANVAAAVVIMDEASRALWVSRSHTALCHICRHMLFKQIFRHWKSSFRYLKLIHKVETGKRKLVGGGRPSFLEATYKIHAAFRHWNSECKRLPRLLGQGPSLHRMKYRIFPARLAQRLSRIVILIDLIKYLTLLAR
jgi:hypothetical protein